MPRSWPMRRWSQGALYECRIVPSGSSAFYAAKVVFARKVDGSCHWQLHQDHCGLNTITQSVGRAAAATTAAAGPPPPPPPPHVGQPVEETRGARLLAASYRTRPDICSFVLRTRARSRPALVLPSSASAPSTYTHVLARFMRHTFGSPALAIDSSGRVRPAARTWPGARASGRAPPSLVRFRRRIGDDVSESVPSPKCVTSTWRACARC